MCRGLGREREYFLEMMMEGEEGVREKGDWSEIFCNFLVFRFRKA